MALRANELRIGNWVSFKDENDLWNPKEATTRDIFNLLSAHESVKSCYLPIPLTEEWLLKFGFEKQGLLYTRHGLLCISAKEYWDFGYYNETKTKIRYAHHLQNLYFYLTEEELTAKQPEAV